MDLGSPLEYMSDGTMILHLGHERTRFVKRFTGSLHLGHTSFHSTVKDEKNI